MIRGDTFARRQSDASRKKGGKGTGHLMDDIRKHGGYMFTKPNYLKLQKFPPSTDGAPPLRGKTPVPH